MAGLNEEARIPVYINDEQAKSALKTLQNEADKWKRKMYEAMEGGDLKGMKEAEREIKKVNKQVSELKREAFDVNKVLSNLSTASTRDMKKSIQLLNREMEGLNRNTKEYTDKQKQVALLKNELYGVNTQLRSQQSLTSRVADGFNKYFGIATAAIASFTGIAFTVKSATEAYAKHDDTLSDVIKTTGLTRDEVKELNKEFSNFDTRTTREDLNKIAEEGGRIGIVKDEILDFVEVMDIANVALKDSFQGGTEEISNMLGKLKFLYKETKDMDLRKSYLSIASAINELGAEGVASEQNIAEFTTRIGALSDVLKPSIADTFALGAGFEESGIQAEIASRAYSIVLNRAATETAGFAQVMGMSTKQVEDLINTNPVDFFFAFAESLKGMNATETARTLDDLKVNADGANKVIGAAANNTDRFRELLLLSNKAFGEANSVITEFTEKNTNAQAVLEKARKRFSDMQIELGEKLTPAYASVIHKGSSMLKVISATTDFMIKHGGVIVTTAATIAAYTIATKLATLWQTKFNTASIASIVTQKLQALAFRGQFAAIALYNSVVALMTGNLKVATIQFRAFSAALMANPVGIVAGAIVALGAGLYMLSKRLTDTEKLQRTLNNVNLDANKAIVEERLEVERLMKIAQNDLQSKEDRLAAIKKLNEISPKYLGNLTLENINTTTATESTKKYTEAILENAKAQASKEKLIEIEKKILDMQGGELSFLEEAKAAGFAYALGLKLQTTAGEDLAAVDKYRAEQIKALTLQKEKLAEITQKQNTLDTKTPIIPLSGIGDILTAQNPYVSPGKPSPNKPANSNVNGESAAISLIDAQNTLLEQAKVMPEATEAEILSKNRKIAAIETEIKRLKELGIEKEKDKPKSKKETAYATNESSGTKAQTDIKKQLLEKLITEEEANDALLAAEIEFLEKKKVLQVMYGDDYQATEAAIIDKKLQAAKEAGKKTEDEKKKAHDKALKVLDNQEVEELNVIKKQLADNQISEEQAQTEILQKEIEFLSKRIALKTQWGEDTAELEGKILDKTNQIAENALKGDEERLKRLNEIRKQFEDEEVLKAQEKADALAEIDALYKAGAIKTQEEYERLKTKIVEKYELSRAQITEKWLEQVGALLQASSNFFSALKDDELSKAEGNAEKQKEIKKKYADKEFALAAAEIIVSTAVAAINAFRSLSVIPVVGPALGAAAAIAVGITGAAQLVKANTARNEAKSLADGGQVGYTGPGSKYDKKQLVQLHAEEYVIPQEGTQNPQLKPVIDAIEIARRNGSLARLDLRQIVQTIPAKGYSSGGYSSSYETQISPPSSSKEGAGGGSYADPQLIEMRRQNNELIEAIKNLKIYSSIEDIRKADKNYTEIQNTRGL